MASTTTPFSVEIFQRGTVRVEASYASARSHDFLDKGSAIVRQNSPSPLLGCELLQLQHGEVGIGDRHLESLQLFLAGLFEIPAVTVFGHHAGLCAHAGYMKVVAADTAHVQNE